MAYYYDGGGLVMDKDILAVLVILAVLGGLCVLTGDNELAAACIGAIAGYISQGVKDGQGAA
ncbi:MAG: hypothetical protein AB7D08_04735 [Bacteroidales bacterium]